MDYFTALPDDFHRSIFNYLSYREKMNLISCDTSFYRLYFQKERKIKLSDWNTRKFFVDEHFQRMILEKMDSPLHQLHMNVNESFEDVLNKGGIDVHIPRFNGVHTLVLSMDVYVKLNERYPDCIPAVQNLHLSSEGEAIKGERILPFLHRVTKSIDFYSLRNLPETLSLSSSIEEVTLQYCNATKLSLPLPNLHFVKLKQSCIQNLNDFQHLSTLFIDEVQVSAMKTDYTALITAKILRIENWDNLSDFSFLQENEEIIIRYCLTVTNYSNCFKNSKKITIQWTESSGGDDCPSFNIDLSYYSQVEEFHFEGEDHNVVLTNGLATGIIPPTLKYLYLGGVHNITNLEGFEHLKKVQIEYCPDITTLRGLGRVNSVSIGGLELKSLEGLGGENKDVCIGDCAKIKDFSPLKHVNRVRIFGCKGFTNSSHLDHVSHVFISSCEGLKTLKGFKNAQSVKLVCCQSIKDFSPLKHVKLVTLHSCNGFTNSSHLDHVAHVIINECYQLKDVKGFRNAESVELTRCPLVQSIEELKVVKNLKVYKCGTPKFSFP